VLSEELDALLSAVHNTHLWFGLSYQAEEPNVTATYLMALVSQIKDEQKAEALERLDVPPKIHKAVLRGIRTAHGLLRRMPLQDPAAIHDALSPIDLETLLFAMSLTKEEEAKKEISKYLLELRHVKPMLGGDDLKAMGLAPGPVYSNILHEVLVGKLRGELKTREDEENFVKEKLAGLKAG
jgi:tRNA nucleotidyltransferase (CCA-adding enzyme)